jgi:hypothetical protein
MLALLLHVDDDLHYRILLFIDETVRLKVLLEGKMVRDERRKVDLSGGYEIYRLSVIPFLVHESPDYPQFPVLHQPEINRGLLAEHTDDDDICALAGILYGLLDRLIDADTFQDEIRAVRAEGACCRRLQVVSFGLTHNSKPH